MADRTGSGPDRLASTPNRECHDRTSAVTTARAAFSVVLPALDEERGLLATLEGLRGVLESSGRVYEVVVVNDGSTDATPRLLAARSDITVIRHADNRGYGAALKAGIRAARHPLVVIMDADGTYPAAAIPALVDRCAAADMVVGARVGRNVHSTPARTVVKWCFRQFAQWITWTRIPDLNSGLRIFHRAVAERFMDVLPDGFSFTTTITVASILEGAVVCFETVDYMPRIGRSKVRPLPDTLRIARQLVRLGLRFAPFRTSLLIALPLVVAGGTFSAYGLLTSGRLTPAGLASTAVGILVFGLGLAVEQQVRRRRSLAPGTFVASRGSLRA
jgi:hypothetical protein